MTEECSMGDERRHRGFAGRNVEIDYEQALVEEIWKDRLGLIEEHIVPRRKVLGEASIAS